MHTINIGVDVGNYDVKTQNTIVPSGYASSAIKPLLADEYLYYNGMYYYASAERLAVIADKTVNDQCIILSLIAIAKEILYVLQNDKNVKDIQKAITDVKEIKLGIGLPPGQLNALADRTIKAYEDAMKLGVHYSYANYNFSFRLMKCKVFPQDFTGAFINPECNIPKKYSRYYIVGIGGGTADVIPVIDNMPDVDNCDSFPYGTRIMYSKVIRNVRKQTGVTIRENTVEDVLRGRQTILKEDVKKAIFDCSTAFTNEFFNECSQNGYEFRELPVVFIGGGPLLLRKIIDSNPLLCEEHEYIKDVHANAKYYAMYID